jgi:uridine kinase
VSGAAVPPIPPLAQGNEAEAKLRTARTRAIDTLLEAEEAERKSRRLRRTATSRLRAYEHMLEEYNGQLTIEETI